MSEERVKRIIVLLKTYGLSGIAFNPGATLTYLTGLRFHLMERPTVLLIAQSGEAAIVLPELEKGKITGGLSFLHVFTYGDDPATWGHAFRGAVQKLDLRKGKIGIEPTCLRFLELEFLKNALPSMDFVDASHVIMSLRLIKDEAEVLKMKRAAEIAQEAILRTMKGITEGQTEKVIANALVIQLLRAGSDPELPFHPIVAIGENSANPHAVPTERTLQPGDLMLVDWGASYEGYFSDITRTFTCGDVHPELEKVGRIVLEANQAGRQLGRPGLDAGAIDRAARRVIANAGYGEQFIHRTGHGLGMEAHEPPYIFAENNLILEPGMTFTIEPGIYLPGRGGVRIEDDVVVTREGLQSLTDLPRALAPIETYHL